MAALSTAIIIGGIVGAAGAAGSSAINARAAGKAARAQTRAAQEARDLEREAESENRRQFDITQDQNQRNWETEQDREQMRYDQGRNDTLRQEAQANARWGFEQRRRAPARAAGRGAVEQLAQLAGITITPGEPPPEMAEGWGSGSLTPPKESETFRRPSANLPPGARMPVIDPNDPRLRGGTSPVVRPMSSLGA